MVPCTNKAKQTQFQWHDILKKLKTFKKFQSRIFQTQNISFLQEDQLKPNNQYKTKQILS